MVPTALARTMSTCRGSLGSSQAIDLTALVSMK